MYPSLDLSDVFLIIRLELYGFWKEYPRGEVFFLITSYQGIWDIHMVINCPYLDKVVFAKFRHWKRAIFPFRYSLEISH